MTATTGATAGETRKPAARSSTPAVTTTATPAIAATASGADRPAGPAVSLTCVAKTFGAVRAVDGVDLEIRRGETVALLGRNGAGKSTTISLALGLDTPDNGTVRLFGVPPEQAVRAGLAGAMLQEGRAMPRITVRELVRFVARRYPDPLPVAETLRLAGIEELAGRRVDRLSGGQTQRVRFAVALSGNPALIVLDEPTAALDVTARRAFWTAMRGYAARGHTVLFSTHYLEEADANADRIVVVDHGRIVADGSSDQLKQAAGGSVVSFDTTGTPLAGHTAARLARLPGVTEARLDGARATLRCTDSDATVRALAAHGAVRGLEVAAASLETAFLALTGDGTTDDGDNSNSNSNSNSTTEDGDDDASEAGDGTGRQKGGAA